MVAKGIRVREDARMRAIVEDGRTFVERVRDPYDLVILDAYGVDSVPPKLTTQESCGP